MFLTALVIEQLEADGYLRTFKMWAKDGRPFTVALADELEEPRRGPFHFLDERDKQMFEQGFAERKAFRLPASRFKFVDDECIFRHSWEGIHTEQGGLSYYSLSLPEFAIPTSIQFNDPHRSGRVNRKHVVRDDQRNRFVTYLECRSSDGTFDFTLEVRYRIDESRFRDSEYVDRHLAKEHDVCVPREGLFVPDDQAAVLQFLALTRGLPQANPFVTSSLSTFLRGGEKSIERSVLQRLDRRSRNELSVPENLPAKEVDLSNYLLGAKLTDRQYEVMSLKYEHGLSEADIARRLGVSRKTIYDHLMAADKRIQRSRNIERKASKSLS
jgi:predicted DNA-binding protein (UPF0251 family)